MGVTKPVILDIGANQGQTVQNYQRVFPEATIHCFEPFPASVAVLQELFQNDPHVTINALAIADRPGQRDFYVNETMHFTNSLLPRPTDTRRYFPKQAAAKAKITVPCTTIDAYLRDKNLSKIDILKMDIQGGELMALQGAADTLSKHIPHLVYTEAYFVPHYQGAPMLLELWQFLVEHGYSLFDLYPIRRAKNGQLRYGNAIFVSPILRQRVIDRQPEEP
jgi:FkbM family methyltransferase